MTRKEELKQLNLSGQPSTWNRDQAARLSAVSFAFKKAFARNYIWRDVAVRIAGP